MVAPKIPKVRLIIAGALGIVLLFAVLILLGVIPGLRKGGDNQTVTLTFWGIDDASAVTPIHANLGKGYRVTYKGFPEDRYESELVDALAEGRGPDAFMIHSSWLPKHARKLTPALETQLSLRSFQALYPTVAEQDFAPDGLIYALPLSIDTLALLYNGAFMDSAGIAEPPKTWAAFEAATKELRRTDAAGRIVRAGAAIGGSGKSIRNVPDILSALFIQAGAEMVPPGFTRAEFASAGEESLDFYTSFANPSSEFYTWNESLPEAVDSFSQERAAMMLGYASDIKKIADRNFSLSVRVAPLPQPAENKKCTVDGKKCTVADYWGIAVSKEFLNPSGAWSFALTLAANPSTAKMYADATGKPPAIKSLIEGNMNDPVLGVFADQALFARSWPKPDNEKVRAAFSGMVEAVLSGKKTVETAIRDAEDAVGRLIAERKQGF